MSNLSRRNLPTCLRAISAVLGLALAGLAFAEGDDAGLKGELTVDRLEAQYSTVNHQASHYWHADGWIGGDTNKLFLKTEGAHSQGFVSGSVDQALYGHAISESWTLEAGAAQTGAPGPILDWAAFAAEGDLPYAIDSEWTLFMRHNLAWLKVQLEKISPLSGSWKFVSKAEVNFYSNNAPANQIGSGLSNAELSLRVARDFSKQVAGYVGYSRYQNFGNTASQLSASGSRIYDNVVTAGLMISL